MTEIDVDIAIGGVTAITVPDTAVSLPIAAGRARLVGWSLRATSTQASTENTGSAPAPAAGTVITSIVLPQGEWIVTWSLQVFGTVGAPEIDNFGLYDGAAVLLAGLNGNVAGQVYPQAPVTVSVPAGGATIAVKNFALATVGSDYAASVSASPVGSVAIAEITSGGNQVAEIAVPVGQSDTHVLTVRGIRASSDLTLTMVSGTMRGAVYAILE